MCNLKSKDYIWWCECTDCVVQQYSVEPQFLHKSRRICYIFLQKHVTWGTRAPDWAFNIILYDTVYCMSNILGSYNRQEGNIISLAWQNMSITQCNSS